MGNADPLIGRTIGGSYVLQELVGVGGMGRVYRAEQSTLGRTVAVKVIHPHLLGDDQTVARFYTEARASSRLNHPNSVSIIDFGRTDDGILYLVMEHLRGSDLATVMYEEGPLPFSRIADIISSSLDALGEAHALDIVHRDLKPENIILRRLRSGRDLVKVVDFGLATIVDAGKTSITKPGLVCGTPDYMAPEQGRGEQVDGRVDLYAAGVMLFELLTERLPYVDETPTKVVMRHIHDPVPDPRQVAPSRQISDAWAELAMRALAKSRDERFQNAHEMRKAVLQVSDPQSTSADKTQNCMACGARNPVRMRFCGSCGARLTSQVGGSAASRARASFFPAVAATRPIVGRSRELDYLDRVRVDTKGKTVWVRVLGESGVGKTRFLKEAADRFSDTGDFVVWSGPNPTGALVSYGSARELIYGLLQINRSGVRSLSLDTHSSPDPLVRAGLEELNDAVGLPGSEGGSKAGAVAAALAWAVDDALARSSAERVVLIVDDLVRCDGLSQEVVRRLPSLVRGTSILLLTAGATPAGAGIEPIDLRLLGLEEKDVVRFLSGWEADESGHAGASRTLEALAPLEERRMLPLYLEQLQGLGWTRGKDETVPPRLADVVAQRIERLGVSARRVLQAASVLGERCRLDELRKVADSNSLDGIEELEKSHFLHVSANEVEIVHPFVRELVEAFIPAEARKELHQRALTMRTESGAPLEVCAEHSYRAGDAMSTLVVLERMGDLATRRGDHFAAVLSFRRALDLARREMLESGDAVMDAALLTFSRKLGSVLRKTGDLSGAEGVLREAMDLTRPASVDRAKMHLALGHVAFDRGRVRDAVRQYGSALEWVAGADLETEYRLQRAMARARSEDGHPADALSAYQRASEILARVDFPPAEKISLDLELAQVFVHSNDFNEAVRHASDAERAAKAAGSSGLVAQALAARAAIEETQGYLVRAGDRYGEAAAEAAQAGDADAFFKWRSAAEVVH